MDIEKEVIDCVNDLVNKVVKKEKNRIYREKNKGYDKKYRANNKDKIKEYREKNRDKINARQREYNKTEPAKKSSRIGKWKNMGIITDDYNALYDHYLKTSFCDACRVKLTYDRHNTATTKMVDHDHKIRDAPNFRNILCHSCNIKRK